MRFDLEQFLAATVALGTAGAIGVAVYSNQATSEAPAPTSTAAATEEEEPFPEAPPLPDPPPKAEAPPSPPPMPALDAPSEELDAAPAPQMEGMNW